MFSKKICPLNDDKDFVFLTIYAYFSSKILLVKEFYCQSLHFINNILNQFKSAKYARRHAQQFALIQHLLWLLIKIA